MQFYTLKSAYGLVNDSCTQTANKTYGVAMTAYTPAYNLGCGSNQADLVACGKQGEPFTYSVSDLAKEYINSNPGNLNNYSYLTPGGGVTLSPGQTFPHISGVRYNSCGATVPAGGTSASGGIAFKIAVSAVGAPAYQQKPPTGIFMLPPSVTRKMSAPLARKTLARSVAKAVPVVGFLSSIDDARRLAQALLDDEPKPNNLQTPAPPSGNLKLMLSTEQSIQLTPTNNNNDRVMPGVTFIDSSIVTNNLYQITQINWDDPETSETNDWLIKALARAMAGVLEAFGRELPSAMSELADLISGTITNAQKAAGEILSAVAQEILGQLSDNGEDGLPDEQGALDYDMLADAIAQGVSQALASYNPPAPPLTETIIDVSSSLQDKLDQYFTIPDTEAGLAETISTNGLIFNPGPMP